MTEQQKLDICLLMEFMGWTPPVSDVSDECVFPIDVFVSLWKNEHGHAMSLPYLLLDADDSAYWRERVTIALAKRRQPLMLTFYDANSGGYRAVYLDGAYRTLSSDPDPHAAFVEAAALLVRRLQKEKRS